MTKKIILKHIQRNFVLIFVIFAVVVFKSGHLHFPYAWDETSSYIPAILKMVKNGPGLLPGAIPLNAAKGHPLLFYFLASVWIKTFSDKIPVVRIFPLIISVAVLIYFHFFVKKHTNKDIADIAVVLLSVQSLFLAQSTLVLPEMLLTLFLLISFDTFISHKYGLFAVAGSLMVLTKETGVIFLGLLILFFLIDNIKKIHTLKFWQDLIILIVPLIIYGLFLLLHYLKFGNFFYKEHIGYITFKPEEVMRKMRSISANLFTRYGRNMLTFTTIAAIIILRIRKEKINNARLIIISILLILCLILFSSINFYTYRYVLPAFPLFIMVCSIILYKMKSGYRILNFILLFILAGLPLYKTLTKTGGGSDSDLSYTQYLILDKKVVEYCEKQNWVDKDFTCNKNMEMALRIHYAGYLTTNRNFKTDPFPATGATDIVIFDSESPRTGFPEEIQKKYKLIKHFKYKKHWSNIYIKSH